MPIRNFPHRTFLPIYTTFPRAKRCRLELTWHWTAVLFHGEIVWKRVDNRSFPPCLLQKRVDNRSFLPCLTTFQPPYFPTLPVRMRVVDLMDSPAALMFVEWASSALANCSRRRNPDGQVRKDAIHATAGKGSSGANSCRCAHFSALIFIK